ncbi:kinase binding protein CGI-121-domain-containing protein [Xylaria arbuscula]|nr:kinase binding protein CGI-121-domain-containing protein [Xylaria arbuscula]
MRLSDPTRPYRLPIPGPYCPSSHSPVMGPRPRESREPPGIAASPNPEVERPVTPSAKRQKVDHHELHPRHSHCATPDSNGDTHLATMSSAPILETLQLEHVPSTHSVHVAVFHHVENAGFLHQQLLARNADFEYALIDAAVITSRIQILSAAFKAITLQVAGQLKTPNVHSEIVYSLSPTSNIAEAYRRHGITPTTRDLVIVKVLVSPSSSVLGANTTPSTTLEIENNAPTLTAQDVEKHLQANVQGTPAPFTDETLSELTDWSRVRKYYKLNGVGWLDGIKDPAAKKTEMGALVMGGMALRGV